MFRERWKYELSKETRDIIFDYEAKVLDAVYDELNNRVSEK